MREKPSTYTLNMFQDGLNEDQMVSTLLQSITQDSPGGLAALTGGPRLHEAIRSYVRSRIFEFKDGSKSTLV